MNRAARAAPSLTARRGATLVLAVVVLGSLSGCCCLDVCLNVALGSVSGVTNARAGSLAEPAALSGPEAPEAVPASMRY